MNSRLREILAGCLKEAPDSYIIQALADEYPSIHQLVNADADDLMAIKGMRRQKARQVAAIMELIRTAYSDSDAAPVIIRSPADVYALVSHMSFLDVEHVRIIGLNTKNHVILNRLVSTGTANASIVHPRETFRALIRRSCTGAIVVHNHPSGDPTPSAEDIALTKKLVEAGEIIDITVLDHIIVGQVRYVSMKSEGLMG